MSVLQKIQFQRTDDDGSMGFLLYGLVELSDGSGYKLETREEHYNARGDNTGFERNNYLYDDYGQAHEQYETWVAEAFEGGWSA
ncbi:hypothetical protein ACQEVF_32360 [Nonomuraea polychroma]|uniref:hypothetical protein n=1 Tax=Nonomuraea polychroma TaxID=46176 RepID=UPI003D907FE0